MERGICSSRLNRVGRTSGNPKRSAGVVAPTMSPGRRPTYSARSAPSFPRRLSHHVSQKVARPLLLFPSRNFSVRPREYQRRISDHTPLGGVFRSVAATTSPGQARILDKASRKSRLAHPPFAFQFSPVTSVTWVRLRPFSRASTRLRSWRTIIRIGLCH
jgi:hypothetical protein